MERSEASAPFKDRVAAFARIAREEAAKLPPGVERDQLLLKLQKAETAVELHEWAARAKDGQT
jgi:hypothetical protein